MGDLASVELAAVSPDVLREAKGMGFSDHAIEALTKAPRGSVREVRTREGIERHIAQIDTLAAEFPADTNYLYTTFHASQSDVAPSWRKKIMVLGSGAYRIGSSVEFDWCCVNAVQAAAALGYETIMLNYNPETVSTDYDVCDRLIFDEVSLETVLDLYERERPEGVVVSMGGQIPNNLAMQLHRAGVKVLGTSPENIDRAEDRSKFSALLDELGIDQPRWFHVTDVADADTVVERLGGFPGARPSELRAERRSDERGARTERARGAFLARARDVSPEHPVVISAFETHAREVEIDAVADQGRDRPLGHQRAHRRRRRAQRRRDACAAAADALHRNHTPHPQNRRGACEGAARSPGPFNVQFLAKHNAVKVIECNLRASRSFPFVSKVTGINFAREAMRRMLGVAGPSQERQPQSRPCRGEGADVFLLETGWRRSDARGGDDEHRGGRVLRR